MRKILPPEIEAKRLRLPEFEPGHGPNGAFLLRGPTGSDLRIIASDSTDPRTDGFEHVSVSIGHRVPNWREMQFVKEIFWEDEETVYQLHPPKSQWINNHPNVLHLWRHVSREAPMPPPLLVGVKEDGVYGGKAEAEAGYRRAMAKGLIKGTGA